MHKECKQDFKDKSQIILNHAKRDNFRGKSHVCKGWDFRDINFYQRTGEDLPVQSNSSQLESILPPA